MSDGKTRPPADEFIDFLLEQQGLDLDLPSLSRTIFGVFGGPEQMIRDAKIIMDNTSSQTAKARIMTGLIELAVKGAAQAKPSSIYAGLTNEQVAKLFAAAVRHYQQHGHPITEAP